MSCFFDKRTAEKAPGGLQALVENYLPAPLSCRWEEENGQLVGTFTLTFSSRQEYADKVKTLLNYDPRKLSLTERTPSITLQTPMMEMTRNFSYAEDFTSADLLSWIPAAVAAEGGDPYLFQWSFGTTVFTGLGQSAAVSKRIAVDAVTGYQTKHISVSTQKTGEDTYQRQISFVFDNAIANALGTDLTDYMSHRVPAHAAGVWTEENGEKTFTIVFSFTSMLELQAYNNQVFDTDQCGVRLYQNISGSTAFRDQNSLEETLDLSAFPSDSSGKALLNYEFSTLEGSFVESLSPTAPSAISVENKGDGVTSQRYAGTHASITLKTNIEKRYKASSLQIETIQNGDNFVRYVSIQYKRAGGIAPAKYAASYFSDIRPTSAAVTIEESDSFYHCRLAMTGDAQKISALCSTLFGEGNLFSGFYTHQYRSIKNTFAFRDTLRFSSFLGEDSKEVPVHYTLTLSSGHTITSAICRTADPSQEEKLTDGLQSQEFAFTMPAADAELVLSGSAENGTALLVALLLFFAAAALLTGTFLILLRRSRRRSWVSQKNAAEDFEQLKHKPKK